MVTITVTDKASTYTTSTVQGKRATSTCSYEIAAQRLAEKLWPGEQFTLRLVEQRMGRQVFEAERQALRSAA